MPALQSSIAKGVEGGRGWVGRQRKGNAFQRRWRRVNSGEKRMHPLLISKRGSCLKFGCLALLASNATRDVAMKFWQASRNDRKSSEIPAWQQSFGPMFAVDINLLLQFAFLLSWDETGFTALWGWNCMMAGITGAVNYTQCEITTLRCCAICLSWQI